jgi:hypothetical protein
LIGSTAVRRIIAKTGTTLSVAIAIPAGPAACQLCRCCRGLDAFYKRRGVRPIHSSMTNLELELFDANPEWGLLLTAYQLKIASEKLEWSPRIFEVSGVALEQLSAVHGKLIALGMLKFEIGSRADGVQYQLTTLGRQALVPPAERVLTPEWMLEAESSAA